MILYFAPAFVAFTLLGLVMTRRLLDGEFTALQISMLEKVRKTDRAEYDRRRERYRRINKEPKGIVLNMDGERINLDLKDTE